VRRRRHAVQEEELVAISPLPARTGSEADRPVQQPQRQVSNTHSNRTLTVSRERAKPPRGPLNPACMKNTRKAVTNTQIVLTGLTRSFAAIAGHWSGRRPPSQRTRKSP